MKEFFLKNYKKIVVLVGYLILIGFVGWVVNQSFSYDQSIVDSNKLLTQAEISPSIVKEDIQDSSETESGIVKSGQAFLKNLLPSEETTAEKSGRNLFLVNWVIDGDTIELENDEKVRYIGIDTPESVHPSKPVECFGKEATNKNRELVEGKKVYLEKDITDRDKYNRLLRYVFLEDETFVNLVLVREGYASSYSYPPDIKYQNLFQEAEKEARENNLGLWKSCGSFGEPINGDLGKEGCLIKGNISSSGEKIYHLPGQRYYDKTVIDEAKGERWFCTEEEAQKAGWRKAKI